MDNEETLLDRMLRYERGDRKRLSEMADRVLGYEREERGRISELAERLTRNEREDKCGISALAERLTLNEREEKRRISALADRLAKNEAEEKDRISKLADRLMQNKKEDDERISRLAERLTSGTRCYERSRSRETTWPASSYSSYTTSGRLLPDRYHKYDRNSRRSSPSRWYSDYEDYDDDYYYHDERPSRRHQRQLLLEGSPRSMPRRTYREPEPVYETIIIQEPKKQRHTTPSWLRGRSTLYR